MIGDKHLRGFSQKALGLAAALAVGCALTPAALAEEGYYKWVDGRGNPVHSDRPPPSGTEYEFVSTQSGLTRRVTAEENTTNPPGWAVSDDNNDGKPQNAAEEQAAIPKDPALCDQARANLDTLNSKARVRIRDDSGIRYLTEEEKNVQRKKAQDLIAVHCSS